MDQNTRNHQDQHIPEHAPHDVPTAGDDRSPQLDKVTGRARHGCQCASSRGDGNAGADGGGRVESVAPSLMSVGSTDTSSDAGDFVDGQEGVEEERFWHPQQGWMSLRDILAKAKCHCYRPHAPPENEQYYGIASLSSSGYLPQDSAMADAGSEDRSVMASLHMSSLGDFGSNSAVLLHGIGAGLSVPRVVPPGGHFNRTPLRLSQEPQHCFNMVIGSFESEMQYPLELSLHEDGVSLYGIGEWRG